MNKSSEVDAWFADYEHPAKETMLAVREMILSDEHITETIKWQSPTFMYKGNMASFNPRTKSMSVSCSTPAPPYRVSTPGSRVTAKPPVT